MIGIILCLLSPSIVTAGDSFPSGPQVGDRLTEFKALAFSGADAGKEFKLLDAIKGKPALVIFVHEITRPGLQFLRPVDEFAAANDKLASHIVWLSADKEKTENYLKLAEKSLNLQVPVSICLEGKDGPAAYGLNDKVKITVLVVKDGKVEANFALADPNAKDAAKVIAAVAKMLGKSPPR